MQALRNFVLTRSWQRIAGQAPRRPSAPQRWDADAHVLVLYHHDDPATVQRVRKLNLLDLGLADAGMRNGAAAANAARPISTLAFTSVPQAEAERLHDVWTPRQLTYGGVPQAAVMEPVLAKAYDLILNLHPEPFAPFDFFCAQAQAHFRIVGHDGAPDAYDIMIDAGDGGPEGFVRAVAGCLRAQNPYVHA